MKKYNPLLEDKNENISLFSDIIDQQKYSKYSNQLNKIFSNYSKFYKDLTKVEEKKPITFRAQINNWLSLSNYSNNLRLEKFDTNEFKSKLNDIKEKEKLFLEKKKKNIDRKTLKRKLISQITVNKVIKIKNKIKNLYNPCLGVYNPLYEAIGKHKYQVTFEKQNFDDFNNKKGIRDKYNNLIEAKSYQDIKSKTINSSKNIRNHFTNFEKSINRTHTHKKCYHLNKYNNLIGENSDEGKKINLNILNLTQKIKAKKIKKDLLYKNEDLLFFPKKIRKKRNKSSNENIFLKTNTYANNTFSKKTNDTNYTERENNNNAYNIKGNVNFDKVKKSGCYFEEIAKKRISPAVGTYHPSYSTVYERSKNVIFPMQMIKNGKNIKKKCIKKIIANYKTTIQYEMFNILNKKSI